MNLVEVEWHDAHSEDAWSPLPLSYTIRPMRTAGYVSDEDLEKYLKRSKNSESPGLSVMGTWDYSHDNGCSIMYIPYVCIVNVEVIKDTGGS